MTFTVGPQLGQLGIVTNAKWAGIKGDSYENIVLVGKCMGIKIFIRLSKTSSNKTTL